MCKEKIKFYDENGEDVEANARYEVCYNCRGNGTTVNPAIDGHGISPEEFAEDPDFFEDYMSGIYDVPCCVCKGKRVVPVIDEDHNPPEVIEQYHRYLKEEADYHAMCEAERRMGA